MPSYDSTVKYKLNTLTINIHACDAPHISKNIQVMDEKVKSETKQANDTSRISQGWYVWVIWQLLSVLHPFMEDIQMLALRTK